MEESITEQIDQGLTNHQEALTKSISWYQRNKGEILNVARALGKFKIQSARLDGEEVDIYIAGDRHVLNAVFGAFRRLGYEPSERPNEKPETSFTCRWRHPEKEAVFYFSFSSNKCTRVKVGTKTQEVDIYETICE